MRGARLLVAIGFAVAAAPALALVVGGTEGSGTPVDALPDLDQTAPGKLSGRTGGSLARPRFFLGFESAAENVGDGPLVILGSRPTRAQANMRVRQRIHRTDGSSRSIRVRTSLRYVHSADHSHWHMLGFMRYELRNAAGRLVRPDRKTGFCLGDRYRIESLEHTRAVRRFREQCGKRKPGLLRVTEGISVGFGDDYDAHLEGQELELTGLPAGRYVLVHRVNKGRLLRESDYRNNAASLAFDLSWPRGTRLPPGIDVVERCPATAACP